MSTSTVHPTNQSPSVQSHPGTEKRAQVPLRKTWPRLGKKVKEEELREEMKQRFGYFPHDWQMRAALKVLEGNDGMVVAGTGKGKTIIFALLGLAAELSGSNGHNVIVSPLKALEGDQVCTRVPNESRDSSVILLGAGRTHEKSPHRSHRPQRGHTVEEGFQSLKVTGRPPDIRIAGIPPS